MAITLADFNKIWASTSPLTPYSFSASQYKEGWNFIGSTPPSRQMWDYLQKLTDEKIQYIYNNMIPTGIVQAFAGSTTPQGWLLCDGSAVSRTDYAALFAVIGTTYGAGNGSTTFNLPNLTDKFIQGSATAGTVKSAGLPNITGYVNFLTGALTGFAGIKSLYKTSQSDVSLINENEFKSGTSTTFDRLNLDASKSSTIYGNSATVQPPALTMRYIIKY